MVESHVFTTTVYALAKQIVHFLRGLIILTLVVFVFCERIWFPCEEKINVSIQN